MARADENSIKEYLLGRLTEADEEQVELRLLTDPEFAEEYDIVVNEVIDDYVAGKFDGEELKQVEDYFFKSPERRNKLKFALALKQRKSEMVTPKPRSKNYTPYLAIAASVLLVVGGFFIWRAVSTQNDVDKGLAALQAAYRDERPLEARISNLNYARYITTRGPGEERGNQKDLRRAELTLREAVEEQRTPAARHALGKVFLAMNDFDKAIAEFEEALKGDPRNAQLYSDLGAAWLEKGKIDVGGKEPGKGMEGLGRSLENLNKALEFDSDLLEARFNRAMCRQSLMLPKQAAEDWRDYLTRDSTSGWAEEAKQQLRLAEEQIQKSSENKERLVDDFLAAYRGGNDEAAWVAISRSRERKGNLIVQRLVDDYLNLVTNSRGEEAIEKLKMLSYVGWLEEQRAGDHFTSDLVTFYKTAAPMQRALSLQARTVAQSARAHYYKVEFEAALPLFEKARELFRVAGNESEALFAQSWVGYCNLRIPRVKESLEIFSSLSQTYERKSYLSLQAQSLNALSDAELSLNEFSKALGYGQRSLKISEKIDDRMNVVRSHGQVVSVLLNLGSYREALGSTLQGLSIAQTSVYDPLLLWHFYHEAALAYYHSGLHSAAFDSENEAERLADISGNSLLKARSLDRRALFYEQAGDYQTAIALLHKALGEAEKISGERSRAVTQVHTTLSLGQLYREIGNFSQSINYYDQTLKLSERLNNLQIYLYRAHKGKLVAFLGLHDDAAAEQELATVVSLFEAYREKVVDESYRNKFFDLGQSTYDIAIDFEFSRRANFEKAFEYAEASRARSLFDLMTNASRGSQRPDRLDRSMAGTRPLLPSEVQSQMPDGVQILQYAVLDDRVVMWVVTRDSLRPAESKISAAVLDETVRRYRDLLSRSPTNEPELATLAKQLYENLITPVESRGYLKADQQLCIVPDKSLNFLPFAALRSPASGRYLIESFTLQLAPSATIFVMNSHSAENRSQGSAERLLSVGNPRFDRVAFNGLPDLPAATREAQQIANLYNSTPLIEDRATPARVKPQLQRADVMHFATHAIIDEGSPLLSKLLLATEASALTSSHHSSPAFLEASELYRMKLPRTRLVVLSACQTGIEKAYRGEGAISLARPFLAAGVPLVVASLWPVDSETTAELMISFHRHRKLEGLSTIEALRKAQIDMIQRSPGSQAPYTWAAFVPIGGYASF
jgi:CHAT domain-containing protein